MLFSRLLAGDSKRRFTIAVVPGVVTLLVVIAALFSIRQLSESRAWVHHTHEVLTASGQLLRRTVDAETGVRAFVIAGDPQFLDPYHGAERDARADVQTLRFLTGDNPVQQRRLQDVMTRVRERFDAFGQLIAVRQRSGLAAARPEILEGKLRMDELRAALATFEQEEQRLLTVREEHEWLDRWIAVAIIAIGGCIAVLVALLANRILVRHATELVQANSELVMQAQRLEEQAFELESQAAELEATAAELEATNVELEEQAVELEEQRDLSQVARAEAEQANAAKSRFLSVMSHELRTPLNAIVGYVDLIDAEVHGPVTGEQREDIRRINRAVSQLTSVINDILNYAKLEAGEVRFELGFVSMHDALANAIALMEPLAGAKGVRFVAAPCDPSVAAHADRERVQQIVLNLLSNAVKYTARGGEIRIACSYNGQMVRVRVSDTGRGIAANDLHRIFDPFVQLLGTTHTPSEGVGLGLAISRDLARGMGGDITVHSTIGKGSVFEVMLPGAGMSEAQTCAVGTSGGNGTHVAKATNGNNGNGADRPRHASRAQS